MQKKQSLIRQVYSFTVLNHCLQKKLTERIRMLTLREKEIWLSSEINNFLKSLKQCYTLLNKINTLTVSNLLLHQKINKKNTASILIQKKLKVKNDYWRLSDNIRTNMTANSLNTQLSISTENSQSDKKKEIAFRVTEINQKKTNLINKHHKTLSATSDHAVKREIKLQNINQRFEW